MKPPCMTVVTQILPVLRVAIAKELVEKHGLKRIEAAEKMDLTPAAITQYLKGLRGDSNHNVLKNSDKLRNTITEITKDLLSETPSNIISQKLCNACLGIREDTQMLEGCKTK